MAQFSVMHGAADNKENNMDFFFSFVGFVTCCAVVAFGAVGVVAGLHSIYDYFVDLKCTVHRIENLINAEDYTGAEEINHE